jgi:hypothetical protein
MAHELGYRTDKIGRYDDGLFVAFVWDHHVYVHLSSTMGELSPRTARPRCSWQPRSGYAGRWKASSWMLLIGVFHLIRSDSLVRCMESTSAGVKAGSF